MKYKTKDKNIKKVVNVFKASSLLSSIGNTIIGNTYVLFLSLTKGFSERQISLIVGVLPLLSVITFLYGEL